MSTKLRMKDMGHKNLTYLVIWITQNSNQILINRTDYLQSVLKKYNIVNCIGCNSAMDVNFELDENSIIVMNYEMNCRSVVGSLIYATLGLRPGWTTSVYYLRYKWKFLESFKQNIEICKTYC